MSTIHIRKSGQVGRITLQRESALNALSLDMIEAIAAALPGFAGDDDISMLVIDAAGDKAFSAGGDIQDIFDGLVRGDPEVARRFWRAEYRMNHALFLFPKPVAVYMQGFTMGGGVGLGCHGSHRVVGESTKIAMPECGIGLMPDVGGTLLLARGPGRMGEYLGTTGAHMSAGDALHAGFADYFVPENTWHELIQKLEQTGDWGEIDRAAEPPPQSDLALRQKEIDAVFSGETFRDILTALDITSSDWAEKTRAALEKNAPLAMACATQAIHRARARDRIDEALRLEYRFAHRIVEMGDFQEGIRASVIDRDRAPKWRHETIDAPTPAEVARMLQPLGTDELKLEG